MIEREVWISLKYWQVHEVDQFSSVLQAYFSSICTACLWEYIPSWFSDVRQGGIPLIARICVLCGGWLSRHQTLDASTMYVSLGIFL